MSGPTAEEIAEALASILDQRRSVQECQHADHHRYIQTLIEREEERKGMYADLRGHLLKWGAVGLLSFLGAACWYWVKNHVLP